MSANNFVHISKKDGKFYVRNVDMDTGRGSLVKECDTFKEAREVANQFAEGRWEDNWYGAEYGVLIDEGCYEV